MNTWVKSVLILVVVVVVVVMVVVIVIVVLVVVAVPDLLIIVVEEDILIDPEAVVALGLVKIVSFLSFFFSNAHPFSVVLSTLLHNPH